MNNKNTVDALEIAKFAQYAAQWWDPQGAFKTLHHINPVRLEFINKHVSLAGCRVLDVGCGGGILAEGMTRSGAVVTGLDAEKEAIAIADAHAREHQLNINYLCQPIETYAADCFDVVTCMEMLEHVAEPALVIEHCARFLKPGGYLFLSTLNRSLFAYSTAILAAEYVFQLLPRQTHDYKKFIKPSELAHMVRAAGLETVGLEGMAYNPITMKAVLQDSVKVNYFLAGFKP